MAGNVLAGAGTGIVLCNDVIMEPYLDISFGATGVFCYISVIVSDWNQV